MAIILLWSMLECIEGVIGLRTNRTYNAFGITKGSERLLGLCDSRYSAKRGSRIDECRLYSTNPDRETWNNLIPKVGNLSKMVSYGPYLSRRILG